MERLYILNELTEGKSGKPRFYKWDSSWDKLTLSKLDSKIEKFFKFVEETDRIVDGVADFIEDYIAPLVTDDYAEEVISIVGSVIVSPQTGRMVFDLEASSLGDIGQNFLLEVSQPQEEFATTLPQRQDEA